MITFDKDPAVAEQQMHALVFSLTAFGYIDGELAGSERDYIREHIGALVEQRARDAVGPDLGPHGATIARWTAHFHEVFEGIDRDVRELFTESVAEGEDQLSFDDTFAERYRAACRRSTTPTSVSRCSGATRARPTSSRSSCRRRPLDQGLGAAGA